MTQTQADRDRRNKRKTQKHFSKKNHPKQTTGSGGEDQDTGRQRVKDTRRHQHHPDLSNMDVLYNWVYFDGGSLGLIPQQVTWTCYYGLVCQAPKHI